MMINDKTRKFVMNVINRSIKSKGNQRYLKLYTNFEDEGYKKLGTTLNKRQDEYFSDLTDKVENPEKPRVKIRL